MLKTLQSVITEAKDVYGSWNIAEKPRFVREKVQSDILSDLYQHLYIPEWRHRNLDLQHMDLSR